MSYWYAVWPYITRVGQKSSRHLLLTFSKEILEVPSCFTLWVLQDCMGWLCTRELQGRVRDGKREEWREGGMERGREERGKDGEREGGKEGGMKRG